VVYAPREGGGLLHSRPPAPRPLASSAMRFALKRSKTTTNTMIRCSASPVPQTRVLDLALRCCVSPVVACSRIVLHAGIRDGHALSPQPGGLPSIGASYAVDQPPENWAEHTAL